MACRRRTAGTAATTSDPPFTNQMHALNTPCLSAPARDRQPAELNDAPRATHSTGTHNPAKTICVLSAPATTSAQTAPPPSDTKGTDTASSPQALEYAGKDHLRQHQLISRAQLAGKPALRTEASNHAAELAKLAAGMGTSPARRPSACWRRAPSKQGGHTAVAGSIGELHQQAGPVL